MSLAVSFTLFFGFIAFLLFYISTRLNNNDPEREYLYRLARTGLIILAFGILWVGNVFLATVSKYSNATELTNLIIASGNIIGILTLVLLFLFLIDLLRMAKGYLEGRGTLLR